MDGENPFIELSEPAPRAWVRLGGSARAIGRLLREIHQAATTGSNAADPALRALGEAVADPRWVGDGAVVHIGGPAPWDMAGRLAAWATRSQIAADVQSEEPSPNAANRPGEGPRTGDPRTSAEEQYLALCERLLEEGRWVNHPRTGKRCLTVINADLVYDVSDAIVPVLTTKRTYWRQAIAEMLGYWRGYDNAALFRALGTRSWDANANESPAWLANPWRKGHDDMGRAYGVQGRRWLSPDGQTVDQLAKVVDHLSQGIDDRREIVTFLNPGEADRMCLPACMHTHTFSLLGDELYLTSAQRAWDVPLGGGGWNQLQAAWLLMVVAQITGNKAMQVHHKIVNAHLYEDQVERMRDVQLQREPKPAPRMRINPDIRTLKDVDTWVTVDDFELIDYEHAPAIAYPMSP